VSVVGIESVEFGAGGFGVAVTATEEEEYGEEGGEAYDS